MLIAPRPAALSPDAWPVLALAAWMAIWWASEAAPIAVTALLPLVVLPLVGVSGVRAVAAPYADPIVLLLLGGFIMATAIERWGLHARIALALVTRAGAEPATINGSIKDAADQKSMWISNTATVLMLAPIAVSVARAVEGETPRAFSCALLLGLAYAASVGGLGTPVGTPTNLIMMGQLARAEGDAIGFFAWMTIGVPAVALIIPVIWLVLTRWAFPVKALKGGSAGLEEARKAQAALGPITAPEIRVGVVFAAIASLWVLRRPLSTLPSLEGLTDMGIAVAGAVVMFLVPSGDKDPQARTLLDWTTAERVPWGVVLLFGGGMSLAAAIRATGLADWAGAQLGGLGALHPLLLTLVLTLAVIFATEMMSNVATISALAPVVIAMADGVGAEPAMLAAPAAMAASCAFMLPIATGPNAIVYATGRVPMDAMIRAGLRLNVIVAAILALVVGLLAPIVLG